MPRISLWLLTIGFLCALGFHLRAEEPSPKETPFAFELSIKSHGTIDEQSPGGHHKRIDGTTTLRYTWRRANDQKTLYLNSTQLRSRINGVENQNITMSHASVNSVSSGNLKQTTFEDAMPPLKQIMQDTYDAPLCVIHSDGDGKEIDRKIVAGPGAKLAIDSGTIANATFFHPPFSASQDHWDAPAELSAGSNSTVHGILTYKKIAGEQGVHVSVTGTLAKEAAKEANGPLTIAAHGTVKGEQVYDPAQREWISGKLTIDMTIDMTSDGKPAATSVATITLTLKQLTP